MIYIVHDWLHVCPCNDECGKFLNEFFNFMKTRIPKTRRDHLVLGGPLSIRGVRHLWRCAQGSFLHYLTFVIEETYDYNYKQMFITSSYPVSAVCFRMNFILCSAAFVLCMALQISSQPPPRPIGEWSPNRAEMYPNPWVDFQACKTEGTSGLCDYNEILNEAESKHLLILLLHVACACCLSDCFLLWSTQTELKCVSIF